LTSSPPPKTGISTPSRTGEGLGFALLRRYDDIGSTRGHGTPCRDVGSCIHIRVHPHTAGPAPEGCLALASLPIPDPALRTGLRGVRRGHLLDAADGLLLQPRHQQAPAIPEDPTVERGLLTNVSSGCAYSALGRTCHAPNVQCLDPDHVEPTGQARGNLLDPVLTPIHGSHSELGGRRLDLGPTSRSWAAPRKSALQATKTRAFGRRERGTDQEFSGGQGSRHHHASIDTDRSAVARRRHRLRADSEGNVPPAGGISGDPVRLRRRKPAGQPESDPADLRNQHSCALTRQHLDTGRLLSNDSKPIAPAGLAPGRAPMTGGEEPLHGLIEISQCLLLHHLWSGTQPVVLCPRLGELTRPFGELRGGRARARSPHQPLLERQIPHEPCMPAVLEQRRCLSSCRHEAVSRHAKDSISNHRHFLKGGRWRVGPTSGGISSSSLR